MVIKKIKFKDSLGSILFLVVGVFLVIYGYFKEGSVFSGIALIGLISLLGSTVCQNSYEVKQLKEIIENGN